MDTSLLATRIGREEFDYEALMSAMGELAYPRDAVTKLLRKGALIRIKKGLYVFGEIYRRRPVSRELLANLAFGPSYISLEFALQHYGLIPERVEAVTSVTTGGTRSFQTPMGLYQYRKIPVEAFRVGFRREDGPGDTAYLIAIPEKALADMLQSNRGAALGTQADIAAYVIENMRMDESDLRKMDAGCFEDFSRRYRSRRVLLLAQWLRRLQRRI